MKFSNKEIKLVYECLTIRMTQILDWQDYLEGYNAGLSKRERKELKRINNLRDKLSDLLEGKI